MYYNLIHLTNPDTIQNEVDKKFAQKILSLNNNRKRDFDSAEFFMELDRKKKAQDFDNSIDNILMNVPCAPAIKGAYKKQRSSGSRKLFDSADFAMGNYDSEDLEVLEHFDFLDKIN